MSTERHIAIRTLKWAYAEDELQGTAEAIALLRDRPANDPLSIGIVIPNYTWATQMQQACKHRGIDATMCIAVPAQARVAQQMFATLTLLANPADEQARETLLRLGVPQETQNDLVARYGQTRGISLVHGLGLDALPPFAHGLRHRTGDEDAGTLLALLRREAAAPTMHGLHGVVPIMDYASLQGTYHWLFLIGCVEGLLPEAIYQADASDSEVPPLTQALQLTDNAAISHFTKIDEATAQAFGISYLRTKQEGDRKVALTRGCAALGSALPTRPTTEGGQAFLNHLRT